MTKKADPPATVRVDPQLRTAFKIIIVLTTLAIAQVLALVWVWRGSKPTGRNRGFIFRASAGGNIIRKKFPEVNFSYALNHAFSGENVWSYHALNVVIHALAAFILLGVVRRTLTGPVLRGCFGAQLRQRAAAAADYQAIDAFLAKNLGPGVQ